MVAAILLVGAVVTGQWAAPTPAGAAGGQATGVRAPMATGRAGASAKAKRAPTVGAALLTLDKSASISAAQYAQYTAAYSAALKSARRLVGTRSEELGAVIANVQEIAAAGQFTASRLPALFLTLERNRQWWTTSPLLAADERVSFPESRIVWEHYPGQGIEIQWLATFGEANGYYLSGHQDAALRQLLGEVIPLATERAGGIAWEYMFHFDGGSPPWTSALSQGTALQVLARAYSRLGEAQYLTAAQRALGIFSVAPPVGVRLVTRQGTWYLQYTFASNDLILNGFIQSLVGLYEYTKLTGDPLGAKLFEAGDAEARARVQGYNTGAWSHYDQFTESTLSYHELLTEFLVHLCERTQVGPPLGSGSAEPTESSGSSGGATGPGGASTSGGATGSGGSQASASAAPSSGTAAGGGAQARAAAGATRKAGDATAKAPIPGDQIYCTVAHEFTADLHTPPRLAVLTSALHTNTHAGVEISLSKVSTVTMTVRAGARVVWTNAATLEAGDRRLLWITPSHAATYSVSVRAVDLAGNSALASRAVPVTPSPTKRPATGRA